MARYPRNRIIVLEAGATAIRARLFAQADRVLSEGTDTPRDRSATASAFGEEAMWYYKRGLARLPLGNVEAISSRSAARTVAAVAPLDEGAAFASSRASSPISRDDGTKRLLPIAKRRESATRRTIHSPAVKPSAC